MELGTSVEVTPAENKTEEEWADWRDIQEVEGRRLDEKM